MLIQQYHNNFFANRKDTFLYRERVLALFPLRSLQVQLTQPLRLSISQNDF